MSERAACAAVEERRYQSSCGGGAGEAPTASPAEGGEGPLETDELAERSEAFRESEQAAAPVAEAVR